MSTSRLNITSRLSHANSRLSVSSESGRDAIRERQKLILSYPLQTIDKLEGKSEPPTDEIDFEQSNQSSTGTSHHSREDPHKPPTVSTALFRKEGIHFPIDRNSCPHLKTQPESQSPANASPTSASFHSSFNAKVESPSSHSEKKKSEQQWNTIDKDKLSVPSKSPVFNRLQSPLQRTRGGIKEEDELEIKLPDSAQMTEVDKKAAITDAYSDSLEISFQSSNSPNSSIQISDGYVTSLSISSATESGSIISKENSSFSEKDFSDLSWHSELSNFVQMGTESSTLDKSLTNAYGYNPLEFKFFSLNSLSNLSISDMDVGNSSSLSKTMTASFVRDIEKGDWNGRYQEIVEIFKSKKMVPNFYFKSNF